jgi:hypothetical protein
MHHMRPIHFCFFALLLIGFTNATCARDIPRTDPERKAFLDAVRSSPEIRFVVKDLYRSGDFAWLCALETENGVVRRTDESVEVNAYILLRNKGAWVSEPFWTGFLGHEGTADCSMAVEQIDNVAAPPASEDDLKAVWKYVVRIGLMEDVKWGHWGKSLDDGVRSRMSMLKEHGMQEDFVIDHPKDKFDQLQFDIAMEQCKDSGCKKTMAQAAADLIRLNGDSRISSMVWENCKYGLRLHRTDLIANCIDTHMLMPHCRPGLHYFENKEDIQHCLGDIAQQCRALPFRDDVERSAVCFMSK